MTYARFAATSEAERRLQHPFSKSSFFSGLLIAGLVIGAHCLLIGLPDREAQRRCAWRRSRSRRCGCAGRGGAAASSPGAWRVDVERAAAWRPVGAGDRPRRVARADRFGGGDPAFPSPAARGRSRAFRDLPAGPGDPRQKVAARQRGAGARLAGRRLAGRVRESQSAVAATIRDFRPGRRADRAWPARAGATNRGIEAMASIATAGCC